MQAIGAIDDLAERLGRGMLAAMGNPPIRIRLWNGREVGPPAPTVTGTVCLRDRGALARLLLDPELQAGELYREGRLAFEGDLVALLRAAFRADTKVGFLSKLLPRPLLERALRNDPRAARRNAQHHYDVGNEFYQLWLDERMLYTCAYFPSPAYSLEDAQLAKMDHVCRKVALRPGQRVIEAGCGWGAFALHMARYFGVRVRAFNVSHEQVLWAREQAEKQGLQDRVEFIEDDYRNIRGECDAFVSVGMLEHVGPSHYQELGALIDRCLTPSGRGLIHTIGRHRLLRLHRWIERRVFPNAHPPTLREMMEIFEPRDFAVLDVENLRRHYALTARHWFTRYERSLASIEQLVGPELRRTWHLYLAGTVAAFEEASLQLFQVVFARNKSDCIPWTRAHVYTGEAAELGNDQAPEWTAATS